MSFFLINQAQFLLNLFLMHCCCMKKQLWHLMILFNLH